MKIDTALIIKQYEDNQENYKSLAGVVHYELVKKLKA